MRLEEQLRNLGRSIEDEQLPVSIDDVAPLEARDAIDRSIRTGGVHVQRMPRHRSRRAFVGVLAGAGIVLLLIGLIGLVPDDRDVVPTEPGTTLAQADSTPVGSIDPSAPPLETTDSAVDEVVTSAPIEVIVPTTRAPATRATLPIPLDEDDRVFVAASNVLVVASAPAPWEPLSADASLGMRRDSGTAEWVGISFWDPFEVATDSCQWRDSFESSGESVAELADALVAVPGRQATAPVPVSVGGYEGVYLEWSLPADLDLATCDDEKTVAWTAARGGTRTHDPGLVDRIWILDVDGERILIDVISLPGEQDVIRPRVDEVIESLRFVVDD